MASVITAVALSAQAQKTYVLGGFNFANISKSADGGTEDNNTLTTFNVGLMHRFGLSPVLDIETGLLFTGKGAKAETYFNGGNDFVKSKFNPLYVELPLNLLVKVPMGAGSNIFFHAGPYAAVGVAGKSKSETKILGFTSSSEKSIDFSDDDPFTSEQEGASYSRLKRFDYGLNFGGGISFKRLMLRANYGLGLAKINSTETNNSADDKNKFRTASISVGIPLGK